jgi:hypothetical protein
MTDMKVKQIHHEHVNYTDYNQTSLKNFGHNSPGQSIEESTLGKIDANSGDQE